MPRPDAAGCCHVCSQISSFFLAPGNKPELYEVSDSSALLTSPACPARLGQRALWHASRASLKPGGVIWKQIRSPQPGGGGHLGAQYPKGTPRPMSFVSLFRGTPMNPPSLPLSEVARGARTCLPQCNWSDSPACPCLSCPAQQLPPDAFFSLSLLFAVALAGGEAVQECAGAREVSPCLAELFSPTSCA